MRRHLPREVWDNLYSFGFVRNPYAWLVSQHRHMLRQPGHHRHETVKALGTFDAYVAWEAKRKRRTQAAALCDRHGRVLVDFVGRFETLADDFASVCDRVGLDVPRLPGGNEGNADDYRDAYADPATRRLAESLFGEDAALFGYTIDGATCSTGSLNDRLPRP